MYVLIWQGSKLVGETDTYLDEFEIVAVCPDDLIFKFILRVDGQIDCSRELCVHGDVRVLVNEAADLFHLSEEVVKPYVFDLVPTFNFGRPFIHQHQNVVFSLLHIFFKILNLVPGLAQGLIGIVKLLIFL